MANIKTFVDNQTEKQTDRTKAICPQAIKQVHKTWECKGQYGNYLYKQEGHDGPESLT